MSLRVDYDLSFVSYVLVCFFRREFLRIRRERVVTGSVNFRLNASLARGRGRRVLG